MDHEFKRQVKAWQCRTANSLVCRAREGPSGSFDGIQATIQPLHTLVNGSKLAHANTLQLQELTLVTRQHEGLDSLPLHTQARTQRGNASLNTELASQCWICSWVVTRRGLVICATIYSPPSCEHILTALVPSEIVKEYRKMNWHSCQFEKAKEWRRQPRMTQLLIGRCSLW